MWVYIVKSCIVQCSVWVDLYRGDEIAVVLWYRSYACTYGCLWFEVQMVLPQQSVKPLPFCRIAHIFLLLCVTRSVFGVFCWCVLAN